jgi:hypothetical protein
VIESPADSVSLSLKVMRPGISISKRCTYYSGTDYFIVHGNNKNFISTYLTMPCY